MVFLQIYLYLTTTHSALQNLPLLDHIQDHSHTWKCDVLAFLERVPSQPKIELQTDPCHLGVTVESGFAGLLSIDAR